MLADVTESLTVEHSVTTRDGRTVAVLVGGDPAGIPVLRLHGTPGGRWLSEGESVQARERGIRLIAYGRPGYGGSSRHKGRSVADCAGDVRAIADALEVRRLGVWGASGGSPHALACAALLKDLVSGAALLVSRAPYDAKGLDWHAGMGEGNRREFAAVLEGPRTGRRLLEREREKFLAANPEQLRGVVSTLLCEADVKILTGEFAGERLTGTKLALERGVPGWLDDDLAFFADWGFSIEQIVTPVLLLHGRRDGFIHVTHAEWLAQHVSGIDARIFEEDGHLSLRPNHLLEAYDWLLERLR